LQTGKSITQFGRDPRCCDKLDNKKLAKVLECWPDMEYKIKDCNNVRYVQYTPLKAYYILFITYSLCLFLDSTTILSRWAIHFIHNEHAKQNYVHYGSTSK